MELISRQQMIDILEAVIRDKRTEVKGKHYLSAETLLEVVRDELPVITLDFPDNEISGCGDFACSRAELTGDFAAMANGKKDEEEGRTC